MPVAINNLKDIDDIKFMPEIKNGRSSRWLSVILLKNKTHTEIEEIIKVFEKIFINNK